MQMADRQKIENLIRNMGELPTIPSVFLAVNKMLSDPRTSATDVGLVVSSDQVITSKILKVANSAFYGFSSKVNTISHAIAVLGFSSTKNIVLTTSVLTTLNFKTPVKGFSLADFWKHSVATGAIAKLIAKEMDPQKQEEAFVAGLLHDIGKLILAICAQEDFIICLNLAAEKKCLFLEAEREVLGVSHPDIAAWVSDKWKLPAEINAVITNHHRELETSGEHANLVAVVKLADVLARGLQLGHACDYTVPIIEGNILNLLKITPKMLDRILAESNEAMQDSMAFVSE
jgi:putative nucleotidyltransferase with HDIG domain